MAVIAARHAHRIEQSSRGVGETDALAVAAERRDRRAAQRPLRHVGDAVFHLVPAHSLAQQRGDAVHPRGAGVGAALVIDVQRADVRVVREHRSTGRRRQHIHRAAHREFGDERRGEHRVAEEAGLDDELVDR